MRGGVPQDLDAFPVAFSDDRHFGITVDSMRGVDELAIHSACERGTRQSGPIAWATSATVTGPGKLFTEPSGRRMFGMGAW